MTKKLGVSVDGGGELITGPALFFDQLERPECYGPLDGKVDVWSGTSAGCIYALLRAIGKNASEAHTLIDAGNPKIFHAVPFWWKMDPTRPKWESDGIEKLAKDIFGDRKCCDVTTPFFCVSFDFTTGKPKIWDTSDDAYLRDVVLTSTAAPTYFQPRNSRYADGGLVSNNPSPILIAGAKQKLGIMPEDLLVLSINTGGSYWKNPKIGARTTKLGWITPIIDAALYGNEEMSTFIADAWIGDRHLRIGPKDTHEFELDATEALPEFRQLWQNAFDEKNEDVRLFLQGLE